MCGLDDGELGIAVHEPATGAGVPPGALSGDANVGKLVFLGSCGVHGGVHVVHSLPRLALNDS